MTFADLLKSDPLFLDANTLVTTSSPIRFSGQLARNCFYGSNTRSSLASHRRTF